MVLKIAFSVDDVNPTAGYGLLNNNGPLKYLNKLNEEFGCKFTLFCIPLVNGDEKCRWDKNVSWAKKTFNPDVYEIAQHGLIHVASDPRYGAQEFIGLNGAEMEKRIVLGKQILERAGFDIKGFKAPGWYLTPEMVKVLSAHKFTYLSDHFMGNKIIEDRLITRVPYTFSIDKLYHDKHDDYMILHSHISPRDGNRNGWTEKLYNEVRDYLKKLEEKYDVEYVTISELVEEQKK